MRVRLAGLIGLLFLHSMALAQTSEPLSTPTAVPKSPSRSATTVIGTLTGMNEAAGTLTVQPATAEEKPFTLSIGLQTRFIRKNQAARAADFETGESVVAKIARGQNGGGTILRELWDAASYASQQKTRTQITVGTVSRFLADAIEVRTSDGSSLQFRVTGKTRITKSGKSASPADFPKGSAVAVKPRGLPSGGVMASIIAETQVQAEAVYQDGLSRWGGTIQSVEKNPALLVLARADGVTRRVLLAPNVEIRISRKKGDASALATGESVTVYLTKDSLNKETRTADRVTVTVTAGKARTPGFPGLSRPKPVTNEPPPSSL